MMPSEHPVKEAYRASIRHALGPTQIEEFADGLLVVDGKGKIVACGDYQKLAKQIPADCQIHDHRGNWIFPGFVDCHTHLPQLDCRNKTGYTLMDWLKVHIYPVEAQFANPEKAREVAPRFYDELLAHGITTAAIYSTIHYEATDIAFQIALEKGLRVIIGQAFNEQNAPPYLVKPARQLLKETEKLILKWHQREGRLFCALTPRWAISCSKDLIKECGAMAKEAKAYFQTHLAETEDEIRTAREMHHFKNYPGLYEKLGCLGSHSLFAHAIYLDKEEWCLLADHQASIAHCPTSNVFLKSGTMPIASVEKYSLRCGFGSDVGAGPTFSMREILSCAFDVHPKNRMDEKKAFYLSTLGGAEALSFSQQIGNLEPGKWADFSVFGDKDFSGKAKRVFISGQPVWKAS